MFKVDVPSATQCPFRNMVLGSHVLNVLNAIILQEISPNDNL